MRGSDCIAGDSYLRGEGIGRGGWDVRCDGQRIAIEEDEEGQRTS